MDRKCEKCGARHGPYECKYVECDDAGCRALKHPPDAVEDLKEALRHWREHPLMRGCSHGR